MLEQTHCFRHPRSNFFLSHSRFYQNKEKEAENKQQSKAFLMLLNYNWTIGGGISQLQETGENQQKQENR